MASNAAVPISLGFDPAMNIPLAGQEGWRPDADDKLPWQVDLSDSANRSGLKEFLQAEAERQEGAPTVYLPDNIAGNVRFNGERWECTFTFDGKQVTCLGDERDGAITAAARYIAAARVKPAVRELTERQLNLIGSIAASGRVGEALDRYVKLSVVGTISDNTLMADPKYADMLNQAVYFCWSQGNPEYSLENDSDFVFFLEQYARGKAHLTVELCSTAWKAFKEQRGQRQREAVVAAKFAEPTDPGTIQRSIDEGTDEEVRDLYHRTMRHVATAR